jgi:CubicO group peptidase (beta-lactamase class C family)
MTRAPHAAALAALLVSLPAQAQQPDGLAALDRDLRSGVYGYVDRVLVMRGDRAVFDRSYPRDYREISRGKDGPLGCGYGCADTARLHQFNYLHPDWHPYHQGRPVHTLQSVTKSIAATAVGAALADGWPSALDRPFLDYFRDRDLSAVDARLKKATLRDLLTMRSGIEWHETDRPLGRGNTTYDLEYSQDWIGFTLGQPMDAEPGTKWAYNSGGSHLMAAVVRSITGEHADEYLRRTVFAPLGIKDFHWKKTPTGYPDAEGGLYLAEDDLARIGQLYLRDGVWNGRRILPAGWVKDATTRHVKNVAPNWDYGYQWWITSRNGLDVWAGRGFGGQLLLVIPSRDLVAVVTSWNVFGNAARGILPPLLDALLQP